MYLESWIFYDIHNIYKISHACSYRKVSLLKLELLLISSVAKR